MKASRVSRLLCCIVVLAVLFLSVTAGWAEDLRVALAQTELRLYPGPEAYQAHMADRVAAAMATDPDLIVFPEDIGLTLTMVDDYALVGGCSYVEEAVGTMLYAYWPQISPLVERWGLSPVRALLTLKAPRVEALYRETFGRLARENGVYIAAGSAPMLWRGLRHGPFNVAYLFGPHGQVTAQTPKCNLIPLELAIGLVPASPDDIKPWHTPLGSLGMMICADSFDPAIAQSLKGRGAELLLNPCANPTWWTPEEEEEFQTLSLPPRVAETGLPGLQCFAVGHLFEVPFEGQSQILAPGGPDGYWIVERAVTWNQEEIVAGIVWLE